MSTCQKSFLVIIVLIAVSGAGLILIGAKDYPGVTCASAGAHTTDGLLTISADLVQDKVLAHSEGKVSMALTLTAAQPVEQVDQPVPPVDLVVVLDRSGSMQGQKINDARVAVSQLLDWLQPKDRLALVTYSHDVETLSGLVPVNSNHRRRLIAAVAGVSAGGNTNLGGGLQQGIDILKQTPGAKRHRKLILISDGLANQGITDPQSLGHMAACGLDYNFAVSTVGVGYDFNEVLMTTLADQGAGQYYFLEDPRAFAQVFEKEFNSTRHMAASGIEIRIPLKDGVQLLEAGGFPVTRNGQYAVIRPGNLQTGRSRKLFLTFQVPTNKERQFSMGRILVHYLYKGNHRTLSNDHGLSVACVTDEREVITSIDKAQWSDQVLQEDYSRLKDEVADAIRKGEKEKALSKIQSYEDRNRQLNSVMQSPSVSQNLDQDVQHIRMKVEETFAGGAAEVAEKKKQHAKSLQYESYKVRRAKQ